MMFVISLIPYAILGWVTSEAGIAWSDWKLWVILGCMLSTDIISTVQARSK